ncbi:MAG: FlgD immunoglobulin-like domain containing protein, partial [bacterium]|nr:FlgD immunoglobulin-like domain containing protein [bacterium]
GTPAPATTALVGIHPNPFNPQTQIQYELAREGAVRLEIYDLQGTLVRTLVEGSRAAGRHDETWDGRDNAGGQVASGVYMARLAAGGMQQMQKMVLLK